MVFLQIISRNIKISKLEIFLLSESSEKCLNFFYIKSEIFQKSARKLDKKSSIFQKIMI